MKIEITDKVQKKSNKIKLSLPRLLTELMLYLGMMLTIVITFKVPAAVMAGIAAGVVFFVLLWLLPEQKKIIWITAAVLMMIAMVLIMIKRSYVSDGFIIFINRVIEQAGRRFAVLWKQYALEQKKALYLICELCFCCFLSVGIAMVSKAVVRSRNNYLMYAIVLPLIVLQVGWGEGNAIWPVLLLILGVFMMISNSVMGQSRKNAAGIQVLGGLGILYLIMWLIFNMVLPPENYRKNAAAESLRSDIKAKISAVRYEKDKTNSLPQGQFAGLGNLELTDKTALKVVMDHPVSLYLRGYVGSIYKPQGWSSLEADTYYDSRDMFYWLHQDNFNAMNQLYRIDHLEDSKEKKQVTSLSVQNVNGNSKYLYTPYGLISDPDQIKGSLNQGDETLKSTAFFGSRVYQYKVQGGLIRQYPRIASDFYEQRDEEYLQDYAEAESNLNVYVYQHYTDIPENVSALIQANLEVEPVTGNDHYPYEEANALIMSYLSRKVQYSEEVDTFQGTGDFLTSFLTKGSRGYSVHYATAGTLMYRYLGIPARYVEGYLITPEDIRDVKAYDEINITGENAHAWVEIYQDGIGWIPMEVTPAYLDQMERPDFELAAGASYGEDGEGDEDDGQEEEPEDNIPHKKKTTGKAAQKVARWMWQWLLPAASVLLGLALAALLLYIARGRYRLRKRLSSFETKDNAQAVCRMYQYLMILLHYGGIPDLGGSRYRVAEYLNVQYRNLEDNYHQTVDIVQEACYSSHDISQNQRDAVKQYLTLVKETVVKARKPMERLRMKIWDFIY